MEEGGWCEGAEGQVNERSIMACMYANTIMKTTVFYGNKNKCNKKLKEYACNTIRHSQFAGCIL